MKRLLDDSATYMVPFVLAAKNYRQKFRAYVASNLRYIVE